MSPNTVVATVTLAIKEKWVQNRLLFAQRRYSRRTAHGAPSTSMRWHGSNAPSPTTGTVWNFYTETTTCTTPRGGGNCKGSVGGWGDVGSQSVASSLRFLKNKTTAAPSKECMPLTWRSRRSSLWEAIEMWTCKNGRRCGHLQAVYGTMGAISRALQWVLMQSFRDQQTRK